MGAGKSIVAIELAKKNASSVIVICPKSLKEQWRLEAEKCGMQIPFYVYSKEEFKKHFTELPQVECVIADECHIGMGNFKSQLHGAVAYYLKKYNVQFVYLLTGTPYTSTCWSIYSLGKLLGRDWNWREWKQRFFYDVKMGGRLIPVQRKKIEEEIAQITNAIGFTKRLDELIDIPEQTFLTEYFDLNKDQQGAIDSLIDVLPIVRWTKIHQIEQGALKSDGYAPDLVIGCEKTQRVIELCDSNDKIAVVARYNLQLDAYAKILKKHIKKPIFIINGATENKNEIIEEINRLDKCVVLINSACSVGYNLWSVPIMVFASMDFSYTNYVQMCGRLLRINHLKKNAYIIMTTSGRSVDKEVARCIENKKDFTIELMSHEKYE